MSSSRTKVLEQHERTKHKKKHPVCRLPEARTNDTCSHIWKSTEKSVHKMLPHRVGFKNLALLHFLKWDCHYALSQPLSGQNAGRSATSFMSMKCVRIYFYRISGQCSIAVPHDAAKSILFKHSYVLQFECYLSSGEEPGLRHATRGWLIAEQVSAP